MVHLVETLGDAIVRHNSSSAVHSAHGDLPLVSAPVADLFAASSSAAYADFAPVVVPSADDPCGNYAVEGAHTYMCPLWGSEREDGLDAPESSDEMVAALTRDVWYWHAAYEEVRADRDRIFTWIFIAAIASVVAAIIITLLS